MLIESLALYHARYHLREVLIVTIKLEGCRPNRAALFSLCPSNFTGIFPPITTPFDHNGEIYKSSAAQRREVESDRLVGYVVCGSTGESVMLTPEEKYPVWELVAEAAAPENC